MRDELRTLRQSGMPLTDNRDAVQGNTLLARHYKQEMANLDPAGQCPRRAAVADAMACMVKARRIVIIGMRNVYPAALHLRQQRCRRAVRCWSCRSRGKAGEELVDLNAGRSGGHDGLSPPPAHHPPADAAASEQRYSGAADKASRRRTACFRWRAGGLCAPLDSVSAYDSYSSVNSLINLLANAFCMKFSIKAVRAFTKLPPLPAAGRTGAAIMGHQAGALH